MGISAGWPISFSFCTAATDFSLLGMLPSARMHGLYWVYLPCPPSHMPACMLQVPGGQRVDGRGPLAYASLPLLLTYMAENYSLQHFWRASISAACAAARHNDCLCARTAAAASLLSALCFDNSGAHFNVVALLRDVYERDNGRRAERGKDGAGGRSKP